MKHALVKLLDRVRDAFRTKHDSRRTEEAYLSWMRRFVGFHGKGHPPDLEEAEVSAFVSRGGRGVRSPLDELGVAKPER